MPRSKKVRLTCDVTPEVKKGLKALGRSIQLTKGGLTKAIRQCLESAYSAKDTPIREFSGVESETCSFEATPDEIAALHAYQDYWEIDEQRKGFKSAMLRGFTIHLQDRESRAQGTKKGPLKSGQRAPKLPL